MPALPHNEAANKAAAMMLRRAHCLTHSGFEKAPFSNQIAQELFLLVTVSPALAPASQLLVVAGPASLCTCHLPPKVIPFIPISHFAARGVKINYEICCLLMKGG